MTQVTPDTNRITVDIDLSDTNDSARSLLDTLDTIRERHSDIIAGVLECRVARLSVSPGDTVVVSTPDRVSFEQASTMRAVLTRALPDGVGVLIMDNGYDLSVIGEREGADATDDASL